MSLHYLYNGAISTAILLLCTVYWTFLLCLQFCFPFLLYESRFCLFSLNFASSVFYLSEKVVVNDCIQLSILNIQHESLFQQSVIQPAKTTVSLGGTSATQRQKFYTDDVKSVRNPVRSADWSTEQLHCFSYCLRMRDKRQKATEFKCQREESLTKQSIFVEYSLLQKKHLSFVGARWQMSAILYQNPPEDT